MYSRNMDKKRLKYIRATKYKNKEYAKEILRKLHKRNMTVKKFCHDAGVSFSTYQDYLRGNQTGKNKGDTKIKKLIKALDDIK